MKCKICQSESVFFAKAKLLNKYDVDYLQCPNCRFVQTEEPYWLSEAYSNPIAKSDVGLVSRNIMLSKISTNIINTIFNDEGKFLDYGGGYGLFVRLMRDLGFDFYWEDKFCPNIFAQGFEIKKNDTIYELLTAFELFEHLVNPVEEIEQLLKYSTNILFSTELLPANNPKPQEWLYYSLLEGQHISIYTHQALSIVAAKLGLQIYSNGASIHLLTKKNIPPILFENLAFCDPPQLTRKSLTQTDYFQALGYENDENNIIDIKPSKQDKIGVKIIIDGVFFQLYKTGIARVWQSLLEEWSKDGFAEHILVLDRGGTAPKVTGIKYRLIQPYSYSRTSLERELLQQICDEENGDLFISTYYTTPISTPSVFMGYDMIPEVLQGNLNEPMWREKHFAIRHASTYITISENTARDLVKFFPDVSADRVTVAHCGVNSILSPATQAEIDNFKKKYGIAKPYFILVGSRSGYKNGTLFFQAFGKLYSKQAFDIVCTGFDLEFEDEFRTYTSGSTVYTLTLNDEELKAAYSGAIALVFPSVYEGFGLPVLEALACGCPVITSPNASLPEVAGEAAIYVEYTDVDGMINALCDVQKPAVRDLLITAGFAQAKKFSWRNMASKVRSVLLQTILGWLNLREINIIILPDWLQPEESLYSELAAVIRVLGTHPDRNQITLLIDTSSMSEDSQIDVNLFLSSVVMNLLMEEDIDVTDGLEIAPIGKLDLLQWEFLLPRIHSRIRLKNENEEAIAQASVDNISLIELDSLADTRFLS
ncbi:glycosyltransferase [Aerosakkonema sp. BLCC-F183]|uniref:glycosyltransferase n=1 Tax=Aerosakkonema sp. BLCC-F183 TaxID=3342834 RepID=UPI0035BC920A